MKFFGWKAAVKKNQRGNKKKHQLKINGITKKNRNSSGGIDEKNRNKMNGINQSKRTQKWKEKLVENGPNLPPKSRKNVAKLMQN